MKKVYFSLCLFLGTALSCLAQWQTNGTTVYNLGNVGVNTATPVARLHVLKSNLFGDNTSTSTTIDNLLVIATPYASANPGSYNGAGYKWGIQFWGTNDQGYNQGKTGAIYAVSEDGSSGYNKAVGLAFHTSATDQTSAEHLRISATGLVGIGTSAPDARLTVLETSGLAATPKSAELLSKISGVTGAAGGNRIQSNTWLVRNASGTDWLTARLHDGVSVDVSFLSPQNDTKTWWEREPYTGIQSWGNGSQTQMTLNNGNLGLGTTNPDAKLAVNGTIHAKEVKVDLNIPVPDYVFEKTYKLRSLPSLCRYLTLNRHLPEVPSAKQMETDGVNLTEMNMKLLQKVEELTLYLIEKDHQQQKLQKEIKKLRDQMIFQQMQLNILKNKTTK